MKALRALVSFSLLVGGIYLFITGLWAEALDLNRSVYHRYGGLIVTFIAAVHVWLNRKALLSYFQGLPSIRLEKPRPAPSLEKPSRRVFFTAFATALGGFMVGFFWPRRDPEIGPYTDVGEFYHQWSKPGFRSLIGHLIQWGEPVSPFKEYPNAPTIPLPKPVPIGKMSVEEALEKRRSIRDYSREPLSLQELSLLLHLTDGITLWRYGIGFRTAPSAGALYPIEIYLVINRVEGLKPGIYHYNVRAHTLELLKEGDFRQEMVNYCLGQEMPGTAAVTFILTAMFQRIRWKYRERAYRYILLEGGHIGQNIYLGATAMGLGACAIGAFLDDPVNSLIGIDGKREAVIYILTVGKKIA
ncbi:MAG: SagB/ThcOx family dehydrogenase [Anaerolineae bacterium]|nr:SagB/ThcOx family dehydrogenase [Anaerolineae bacterium]MDW8102439.1 SagB/ThcOx family dehydrogenase [Anaerolineae bacterium]